MVMMTRGGDNEGGRGDKGGGEDVEQSEQEGGMQELTVYG